MFKKVILLICGLLLVTGCNNKVEEEKNEYLDTKSLLETNKDFIVADDLPCDVTVSLERTNEENVNYNVMFNNPKENMNDVKILVIHNQYTEDIFPYIGLMDSDTESLLVDNYGNSQINIPGKLSTTNDIDNLSLEFRIWLEYIDDSLEKKTIYYKTTI